MTQVLYVAHPLGGSRGEDVQANLASALRWLHWLRTNFRETVFIAPWIASVMAGADDTDPSAHEHGLRDDCEIVRRCDGIVLVGGRVSAGMQREADCATWQIDLTNFPEPPTVDSQAWPADRKFAWWARCWSRDFLRFLPERTR